MDYLNEIEQEKISAFLKDIILKEAIKKVLLKRIYSDGTLLPGKPANPKENFALNIYKNQETGEMFSDEELGRITKVKRMAIELIEKGLGEELEKFKKVTPVEPEKPRHR